ncbi:hypothetical protein PUN28_018098 [Cardiocondyla obscurior]|uniref:Uncharacterized protein n=1 Tax=Cardiocondyla obscurior TaxID=286306 RepID=A0AAW2EJM9_9HYME
MLARHSLLFRTKNHIHISLENVTTLHNVSIDDCIRDRKLLPGREGRSPASAFSSRREESLFTELTDAADVVESWHRNANRFQHPAKIARNRGNAREKNFSDECCTTKAKREVQMVANCAKSHFSLPRHQRNNLYNRLVPCNFDASCPALRYCWITLQESCIIAQKIRLL